MLAFSKAETLPEREEPEDIDLRDLITSIIARESLEADIKLDVPTDLHLCSIRNALDRAIGNFLRNAVRYAGNAGPIQLHTSRGDDKILILISDQGPGVPSEALRRLFEPFYRPEAARQRSTGGSGLGLAITKRCIEACGGTVIARLREPRGLEIEISIPST